MDFFFEQNKQPKATTVAHHVQPKIEQVNSILDSLRERHTITEISLAEALAKTDGGKTFENSRRLLLKVLNLPF